MHKNSTCRTSAREENLPDLLQIKQKVHKNKQKWKDMMEIRNVHAKRDRNKILRTDTMLWAKQNDVNRRNVVNRRML
jgi:hypothetical protein